MGLPHRSKGTWRVAVARAPRHDEEGLLSCKCTPLKKIWQQQFFFLTLEKLIKLFLNSGACQNGPEGLQVCVELLKIQNACTCSLLYGGKKVLALFGLNRSDAPRSSPRFLAFVLDFSPERDEMRARDRFIFVPWSP